MLFLVRAEFETKCKIGGDLPDSPEQVPIRSALRDVLNSRRLEFLAKLAKSIAGDRLQKWYSG